MPGVPELLVILAIVFLVFGASRLPQLARSLGKARTEFQKGVKESGEETQPSEEDKTSDGAQS
jgi:sec-independent protein translocase protein TatA